MLKVSEKTISCILLNSTLANFYIGCLDSTLKFYNYKVFNKCTLAITMIINYLLLKTGKQVSQDLQLSSSIRCMHQAWGNIYLGTHSGQIMTYNIKVNYK